MSIEMEIAAIKKAIHVTNQKLDKLIELQTIVAQSVTVESEITANDSADIAAIVTASPDRVVEMIDRDGGVIARLALQRK